MPPRTVFESSFTGFALQDARDPDTWVFLTYPYEPLPRTRSLGSVTSTSTLAPARPGGEVERSPYSGCVYDCVGVRSKAALIEQVAAAVWENPAVNLDDYECKPVDETRSECVVRWVWP